MTVRQSILRRSITERKPLWCFKSNIPDRMIIELLGGRGCRCLWLDMEHLSTSLETMAGLVQACRGVDIDSVVRVPNGDFVSASRALDLGADAILYPRCRSAAEVRQLVEWVRYPPVGRRGLDTGTYIAGYCARTMAEIMAGAARRDVLIVQIETAEALANVDAIAEVRGVDMLFVGPGDLSVALGCECRVEDPRLAEAIERVAQSAAAHNLAWGMPALSLEHVRQLVERGALFVTHGSDTSLLGSAVHALHERLTPIFGC
jgi:4-hydroxy-2-oxoheptanedioate aldolase